MRSSYRMPRGRGRRKIQPDTLPKEPSNDAGLRARLGRDNHLNISKSNDHDRRMELISSVSRSSGLEKDGDLLKDRVVQEEFRTFIDKKLRTFWDMYGAISPPKAPLEPVQKQKKDNEENILILFRKLREGLFASGRTDGFAIEVYETSLYLSVIFDSPTQTTTIVSRLVPHIYSAVSAPQPFRLITTLISLLHHIVISFPSQQTYLEQIKYLAPNLMERSSDAYLWISTLARSLRTANFVQFEKLSHPDTFEHLLPSSRSMPSSDVNTATLSYDLPRGAVHTLISQLRIKLRDEVWKVMRNAYRELSSADETRIWLGKRLFFDNCDSGTTVVRFDEWVREKCRDGHLRPKEGMEGRWTVCKPR